MTAPPECRRVCVSCGDVIEGDPLETRRLLRVHQDAGACLSPERRQAQAIERARESIGRGAPA